MVAMTSTVSRDGGLTFVHSADPPGHLVAAAPLQYDPNHSEFGYGDPSGIIRHRGDGMYYMTLHSRTTHGVIIAGTGLMRTANVQDWKSWRCWNGTAFSVAFVDPYAVPRPNPETLSRHICAPIHTLNFTVLAVKWSDHFGRYIAIGEGPFRLSNGSRISAFMYTLSAPDDDRLTRWESPPRLIRPMIQNSLSGDNYPSLLDNMSSSSNFETIGRQAWLYFTRQTRSTDPTDPCGHPPFCRNLMRQRIIFGDF